MKKLKAININGLRVPIGYQDFSAEDFDGITNEERTMIALCSSLKGENYDYSLLHECGHVLFDRLSLNQCISKELEEVIVDGFAKWITETFQLKLKE